MIRAAVVLLACLMLSGCDDVLSSTKLDPVQDDRMLGKWIDPDGDPGEVVRSGPGYRWTVPDEDDSMEFTLVRAGTVLFAQIPDKCESHAFSFSGDTRTCYRLQKIEFGNDDFSLSELGLEGFQKESAAKQLKVQHKIATSVSSTGDKTTCVLIEGTAEELTAMLAAYPKDAYEKAQRIKRAK